MTRKFRLADEADELKVHQRLDVARHVHASDCLDLGLGERLPVGDDRQCLERSAAKPVRAVELEHGAHIAPAARRRLKPVRAARADELESGTRDLEGLLETAQSLVDLLGRAGAVDIHDLLVLALLGLNGAYASAQLAGRERRFARKQQGADDFLEGLRQRDLHFVTHSHPVFQAACRPASP